ncbi:ketopantoate reductase family protein [Pseudoalteromonas luteoviolacea]|uniref:2-dehydropantoate 2-reductase n=1 Tax=Pseudoalteromonas luteoviolacea (strain 2ta16) TaxID=1353533 RepID=V4HWG2_PSEL2|nr:2-dehydropantoate 2-reductase [Pseudoalteromonas luteoviolacea]ESP95170.1 2-dehydropantoate 2-reductase [Pseudoalteromonas luteoviolacea 2ta16]KZN42342.1 hypothetical protein N483_12535 [Pseudoalteromonas luteoviolacea NCIMB 1944]
MSDIYILGCGAVGLLLAEKLSHNHCVTLITRTASKQDFFFINGKQRTRLNVNLTTLADLNEKIHTCIVPVKAYQLVSAMEALSPHLSQDANVILSHNGMSDLNHFNSILQPTQALYFLSTSMGGMKPDYNTVIFKGPGLTQLGACNVQARRQVTELYNHYFMQHFEPIELTNDIAEVRWQKLCVNIAINPLTALLECPNGALQTPAYATQVLKLLNEACFVAQCEGVELQLATELARAYKVMALTQHNTSSMAQDIKLKRQTEIDAICGYIATTAKKYGYQATENEILWQQVKRKEQT